MASTVRLPIGTIVVLALGLLLLPQTADVLAGLADGGRDSVGSALCFHLAAAGLAVSAWYWSRAALAARFPEMELPHLRAGAVELANVDETAWRWMPRLVFLGAAACGLVAALRSGVWLHAGLIVLWCGLLLIGLWLRRRLFGPREDLAPQLQAQAGWAFRWEIRIRLVQLLRLAPGGALLAGTWFVLGAAMLLGSVLATFGLGTQALRGVVPAWPGMSAMLGAVFPGPGALFVAIAFALPVGTALSFVADGLRFPPRWHGLVRRPPVLLPLVLMVAIVPAIVPLHAVRIVTHARASTAPAQRQPLGVLFARWIEACAPGGVQPVRPVIVAVSGGASRAALWAARVLRDVETALPPPGPGVPAIFAVSSVSGGSLGAGAWISTLAGQPDGQRCRTDPAPAPQSADGVTRADRALSMLGGDVLAPPLAGMLVDDVPRALVGWIPALVGARPLRGGDRGEAEERGFELLWRDAGRAASDDPAARPMPFDRGFLDLFYGAAGKPRVGMPLWLPNATDSVAGRRVLPTAFASDDARQWPFRDTRDALALLGADLPISTAIDNSARFAVVSPAGELAPLRPARDLTNRHHNEVPTSVIDGGYFENGGLLTALELAEWLQGPEGRKAAGDRPVEPIIIQATADGDRAVGGEMVVRCGPVPRDDPASSDPGGRPLQMLASPIGLNLPRGGLASVLQRKARDAWCPGEGHPMQAWFQFYLHAPPEADMPLNWVLSDGVATWIWHRAMHSCDNAQEMARLRATLMGRDRMENADMACPDVAAP